MTICRVPGCTDHYGCRLKAKSIQVSVTIHPSQAQPVFRPATKDQWGSADARDDRGVKVVRDNGTPLSLKEYREQRHRIHDSWAAADAGATRES